MPATVALTVTRPGTCEDRVRELKAYISKLREALFWCGGSSDFAPGGSARAGWEAKIVPLFTPVPAEREP
jgi:hypothetical protein